MRWDKATVNIGKAIQRRHNKNYDLGVDISVRGFWQRLQRVRVSMLGCSTHSPEDIKAKRSHPLWKKSVCMLLAFLKQSMAPLLFSSNGSMRQETTRIYAHLSPKGPMALLMK